ncbi:hypothetical protein BH10PSE10_BH10PSE10_10130 [soil metagenome]
MAGSPAAQKDFAGSSFGTLVALSVALAAPAVVVVYRFEPHLVLPALSVLFFVAAALAAVTAFSTGTRRNTESVNLWDVAGGLVMTGCAASVMGEPEQVAQLFEHLFETRNGRRE